MAIRHPPRRGEIVSASAEVNDLSAAVTWANVPDANITESSVTQHAAAISTALSLNVANWDTAYGWGDHAGTYLPLAGGSLTGDLTLGAALHLNLPTHNDAVTPTLTFGSSAGIYQATTNNLSFATQGLRKFMIDTVSFRSESSTGAYVLQGGSSATVPTFCPRSNDTDTGVGSGTADTLSLIAGGVEFLRATEDTTDILSVRGGIPLHINDSANSYELGLFNTSSLDAGADSTSMSVIQHDALSAVSFQTVTIADDATAQFQVPTYAMVFIICNFNSTAFAHFGKTTSQAPIDYGSGSIVNLAATVNPDVDGQVNIWSDSGSPYLMNIKNRLGSTRVFYVMIFGNSYT